jgi:hypothetical protein
MLPMTIKINGKEAKGLFFSFRFLLKVFERKKAERGSPASPKSSSLKRGTPARWRRILRTDDRMTVHPVRRLDTHNPQQSSLACHSK